ncbi:MULTISPECIES: GspH/FimT family pseudopilin [unclassified Pseudomonas]|uniref:GspH/FimT family pseudopilin n=1 Tax=unclassified Pseudomonas TaxID=196821 RepID=UPI002447422C|nr:MULTISPECIES: GspH/FimT family pseudopilin [unclassified Pseudomonas]MDG9922196.1 GspH/FimT family pseudopilin [Pseudomonas sp. GD04045]MDH0033711.1 GspH/FimT family pseudopilin [Pseudomonas sp. GD04019]
MRVQKGFTLVELMVVIAVLAAFVTIALPAFADLMRGVRASSDVSAITTALSLARSEAVKRNQRACVSSASWAAGWEVKQDATGNGSCSDSGDTLVRTFRGVASGATLEVKRSGSSITEVVYEGSGRQSGGDVVLAYRSVGGACSAARDRDLTVGSTGRTKVEVCTAP